MRFSFELTLPTCIKKRKCEQPFDRALASFIGSVPLLLLAGYTIVWHARLDPVYTPLQCKEMGDPVKHTGFDLLQGIVNVQEVTKYECENSNPYVLVVAKGSGSMILWSTMTEIGDVAIPQSSWERGGDGVLTLECNIHLSGFRHALEVAKLLEGPQDTIQNMTITTQMQIPFLFFKIPQVMTQHQICGKKIDITTERESALNCADSFSELRIADFDEDASIFMMKTTRRVLGEALRIRDLATGAIVTVTMASSVVLLVYGSFNARRAYSQKTIPKRISSGSVEDTETDQSDRETLMPAE